MKERQLRRLAELPIADRVSVIAEGLGLIAASVRSLSEERERIHQAAPRASLLLETLADEEAAKAFILVDYLRPPSDTSAAAVAAHLKRVYDHMARGVYAYYYNTRPASFREVMEIVERERVSLYLDGPEGFEWIFRNGIMQRREEAMYVDWVEMEGEMRWQSPSYRIQLEGGMPLNHSMIVGMLLCMTDSGLFSAAGLTALRTVWQAKALAPETKWIECLAANRAFLAAAADVGMEVSDALRTMVERHLLFPLTGLDTSMEEVDRTALRDAGDEAVRNWNPW